MAGTLRLLNKDGVQVSNALAMGLTTGVRGIDHIGGNTFYAVDTKRLWALTFTNGAIQTQWSVNLVNQVTSDTVTGLTVLAICSNEAGHWIVINVRAIDEGDPGEGPPPTTEESRLYRFTLDGILLHRLQNWWVTTLFAEPGIVDLTHDGAFLYISWQEPTALPARHKIRMCYYDNGRSIRQASSTKNSNKFNSFCWNGNNFYVMKFNNANLAVYDYPHVQIKNLGAPGLSAAGICTLKGTAGSKQYNPLEGNGNHITDDFAVIMHVR